MGPVVDGMGHMNGTGFYPANTPDYIPNTMRRLDYAWDIGMKNEMMHECHDCRHLLQHVWIVDRNGVFQPHGSGGVPTFRDRRFMGN